ncbi:MAG TPA: glycosyltransferase, partial [Gemmatimonadales bacterium]|nr:glycosyltransferase [Gemmatimonadales bacterium]
FTLHCSPFTDSMRTFFVSHAYLDAQARGKLRALVGQGCAVTVAVPEKWPGQWGHPPKVATWQDDAGVRVVPIPVSGGREPRWSRRALFRLISDARPDVIQVEEEPETTIATLVAGIAHRLKVPLVVQSWTSLAPKLGFGARWRRKRTLGRAAGLVAGNELARAILARERQGIPLAVIPQLGVTPPLTAPRHPPAEFTMAFVGRLVPEKGLDVLLRACVKLHGRWQLKVIGSGPSQVALEDLAERLGLAARVTWLGALEPDALPALWPSIDALVLPSRSTPAWVETWSYTLVEAMAAGVAAVTSDAGALPEIVGSAGVVVPENDAAALTAGLQRLRDDRTTRETLGAEGRKRVMEEFGDAAVAGRTVEFWKELRKGA